VNHAILTHGGAASPQHFSDGCAAAAAAALAVLEKGGDALAAALAATAMLEDDPRFNAGTGANLRLDGQTIEMDAAVMTSDGRFGGVGAIERVKNPILVAARVMDTPHLLLVGPGATAFARRAGFPDHDPLTEGARSKHARALAELRGEGDGSLAAIAAPWHRVALDAVWNFPGEPPPVAATARSTEGCDTVGAVVRDRHGRFAATASTGGTTYMLRGRIGDSPIMGAGVYAGPAGAVATTGVGEEIVRRFLAKTVYDWLAEGVPPTRAAQRAVAMFPEVIDVGLLVAGLDGHAVAANRHMASALLVDRFDDGGDPPTQAGS
jgi:isoaspartyl peptidase/L-asparaginase-like protein (Ntn-hydrolase superfamily)